MAPATGGQAPAAGSTSCEATNTPDAPGEADPADKSADKRAEGVCLACSKQLHVPENLRRRNALRGWPPHARCRPCKLANDAHYAALENTDAKFRAASPAALVTSDGETSPAPTAASDDMFRTASPAALVTSDGKPPKMNWLLATKGLLSANA